MTTPDQVRARLQAGRSYEAVARELGIAPGLAYMLATGAPADFSDDLHLGERDGRAELADSSQRLVNPQVRVEQLHLDWLAVGESDDRAGMNLVARIRARSLAERD